MEAERKSGVQWWRRRSNARSETLSRAALGVGYGRGGARDEDDVPFLVAFGGDLGKSAGGFYGLFVRDGELRKKKGGNVAQFHFSGSVGAVHKRLILSKNATDRSWRFTGKTESSNEKQLSLWFDGFSHQRQPQEHNQQQVFLLSWLWLSHIFEGRTNWENISDLIDRQFLPIIKKSRKFWRATQRAKRGLW
jgi:hypothetical protein